MNAFSPSGLRAVQQSASPSTQFGDLVKQESEKETGYDSAILLQFVVHFLAQSVSESELIQVWVRQS